MMALIHTPPTRYTIAGATWRLDVELVRVVLPDGHNQWVARFPTGQLSYQKRHRETRSTLIFQEESAAEMLSQLQATVAMDPGAFWSAFQMMTAIEAATEHARRLSDPVRQRELEAGLVRPSAEGGETCIP